MMSNFLYEVITFDLIVSPDLVVAFSSYLTFDVKSIDVVSGVTITGVTLATLYFLNCLQYLI